LQNLVEVVFKPKNGNSIQTVTLQKRLGETVVEENGIASFKISRRRLMAGARKDVVGICRELNYSFHEI
jgi:hypothetical protein